MSDSTSQGSLLDRLMAWSQEQRNASAQAQSQINFAQQAFMASAPPGGNLLQQWMQSPKGQATGRQAIGYALGMGGGVTPIVGPELRGVAVADALHGGGAQGIIADGTAPLSEAPTTILPSGPTIKLPDQTQVQGVPYKPFVDPEASIVWHGSRHTFEPVEHNPFGEFSDQAIGSGEGAQVFGTGHYVAQNPGIASYYRTAGVKGDPVAGLRDSDGNKFYETTIYGKDLTNNRAAVPEIGALALDHLGIYKGDIPKTIEMFQNAATANPKKADYFNGMSNFLQNNIDKIYYHSNPSGTYGNLYQVEMSADPGKMLDWETKIADQPDVVKNAVANLNPDMKAIIKAQGSSGTPIDQMTGGELINAAKDYHDSSAISEALRDVGLHGIAYPDAASRTSAPGTKNFVIFDPKHLSILGRNGVRYTPESVDHDPFQEPAP